MMINTTYQNLENLVSFSGIPHQTKKDKYDPTELN